MKGQYIQLYKLNDKSLILCTDKNGTWKLDGRLNIISCIDIGYYILRNYYEYYGFIVMSSIVENKMNGNIQSYKMHCLTELHHNIEIKQMI